MGIECQGRVPTKESDTAFAQSKDDINNKANKDNITYSKEQRSINRCVTVHEVDLVVQLGLGRNSCVNRSPFVHLVSWSHMWRSVF